MKLNVEETTNILTDSINNIISFCEQNIISNNYIIVEKSIPVQGSTNIITIKCYLNNYQRVKGDNQIKIDLKYGIGHFVFCESHSNKKEDVNECVFEFVSKLEEYLKPLASYKWE